MIDWKVHNRKSKVLKVNMITDTPIKLEGEALDEVESFTYHMLILHLSGKKSFKFLAPKLWNTLNNDLRTTTNITYFRNNCLAFVTS